MKRARCFPQRLIRWTSLCISFVLVLTSFVLFPSQVSLGKNTRSGKPSTNSGAQGNGQERRVNARPPQPGPPAGKLPNLDEMRSATDDARRHGARPVRAPQPVPSTQRRWWYVQPANRAAAPAAKTTTTALKPAVKANHSRGSNPAMSEGSAPEPQGGSDMAMARIDPYNRTGAGGVDLLSQNFNWSLGLVALKGRGLDLGLSLSYNSLSMWTRSGNEVAYNMDKDATAPGFRLGFPTVQGPYDNSAAGVSFYMLITPAGQHVELRHVGTSSVYQAVDASYSQLTYYDPNNTPTDTTDDYLIFRAVGSELKFYPMNDEWRCTEVKDRNGNYISIAYDSSTGNISTVTDTLGRVVTFHYDSYHNIQSITQPWGSATHTWASFSWTTTPIGSGIFSGTNYTGPPRGSSSISVLEWVGLPDGSRYYFDYDGSYGMVSAIKYYAPDDNPSGTRHERRQVTYAYDTSNGKVPRVNSEKDWAENWNGDTNGVPASSEEVETTFSQSSGVGTMTLPDSTVYKEVYGTGYQSGLVTMTKNYLNASAASSDSDSNHTWKKKTTTTWTQESPTVSYLTNPRVTQTEIWDSEGNYRKTTIDYSNSTYAAYSLPYIVKEWDGSTLLRSSYTNYNLSSTYTDKRIIGLISESRIEDSGGVQAKTTYEYDSTDINSQALNTTHHYSSYSTTTARGNVTKVFGWDATASSSTYIRRSQIVYDTAGSVMSNTDALDHANSIGYSSSYYYAYPTTMSDAASNSSTVQYDFDTGAVTQTQGPPPAGQSAAMAQSMSYDSVGRLQWITRSDGFWKYIAYADRGDAVMSQISLTAYPDSAWSITVVDGADRTRLAGRDLPNSTGGYAGAFTLYDNMGRVSQRSNVEETNAYWSPAGDDSAGWVFNNATIYDWKGRPTRSYNMDGTYNESSYTGCVGAAVVVTRDEIGRRQKITFDPLGRLKKTEILYEQSKSTALDGSGTVYSTAENTLDALDHVTQVTQTDNATSAYQTTTMGYDGYGRLHTKHVPEQSTGTATTYAYNDDDTTYSVTDARGASATYTYNSRHLVTGIAYYAASGVASTPNVSFDYDAAGNRTSMTDGIGSVSYSYDTLSRLTSETRHFNDLASLSNSGNYTLSYSYDLSGQLTGVTDQSISTTATYSYDSSGRLTAVGGSGFPNFSTFASNFEYRAWGAIKAFDYGNSVHQAIGFNDRRQLTSSTFSNVHVGSNSNATIAKTYDYYDDGSIFHAYNGYDARFDRAYTYDHAGRIVDALSGSEARGGTTADGPYKQQYSYDVWTDTTARTSRIWTQNNNESASYSNNRRQYWGYDAEGHATSPGGDSYDFDVAARPAAYAAGSIQGQRQLEVATSYDADGASAKQIATTREGLYGEEGLEVSESTETTYYLRSSALGGKLVAEIAPNGARVKNHLYAGGMELAQPFVYGGTTYVTWLHTDPVTGSSFMTETTRTFGIHIELGTLGEDVTTAPPPAPTMPSFFQAVWPAEYTWGPSEEFEKGNAWWAGIMSDWVHGREALGAKERATKKAERSRTEEIRHENPNVVVAPAAAATSAFLKGDASAGAEGKNNGYVTITATELGEAGEGPQNPDAAPDIAGIRSNLANALKDGDCSGFIKDLLSRVSSDSNPLVEGGDLLKIFDIVTGSGQGGVVRGTYGGGREDGSIGEGNATILLGGAGDLLPDKTSEFRKEFLLWSDSDKIVHEITHAAGLHSYSDWQLAVAVSQMPDTPPLPAIPYPHYPTPAEASYFSGTMSTYWNGVLKEHCKQSPMPTRPGWHWGTPK